MPTDPIHTEEIKRIYDALGEEEMKKVAVEGVAIGVERWMNKKFAQFGKWTLAGIGSLLFGLAVKFLAASIHWQPPSPPVH